MKKKFKFLGKALLLFIPFLVSCSTETEEQGVPTSNIKTNITVDLQEYAQGQENLYNDAKYGNTTTRGGEGDGLNEEFINKIGTSLQAFIKEHDIYADLTEEEKHALNISKDSVEMMELDPKLYLAFVKKHKSETFYDIILHLKKVGRLDLTQDEIINNTGLKLNEKVQLLTVLPIINSTKRIQNITIRKNTSNKLIRTYSPTKTRTKETTTKEEQCQKELDGAKSDCMYSLVAEIGIAAVTAALGNATGTVVASMEVVKAIYDYNKCCDYAEKAYKSCIK